MKLRKYETVYVVRADLTEEKQQQLFARLDGIIQASGGKVLRFDDWGVRKTAYLVQKHSKAHYQQITYAGAPGVVAELERIFRMLDEVMKFYSMKVSEGLSEEELAQEELIKTEPRRDEGDRYERRTRRDYVDRGDRGDRGSRGPRNDRNERSARDAKEESVEKASSDEAAVEAASAEA